MTKREIEQLKKRLEELEDFKLRIETGAFYLKCTWYVIGSVIVTTAAFFAAVKDWPFRGH